VAFVNSIVGVGQAILHSRQNSFYSHESDLVFYPVVEKVKNYWPNSFEFVVLKLRFTNLHQLEIHGVQNDCATRF